MLDDFFEIEYLENIFKNKVSLRFTRGIDGISIPYFIKNESQNIEIISRKIKSSNFHFSPYLEKLINKGRSKRPRIISIPTIKDRIVLYALKDILHHFFPECVQRKLPNEYVRDMKDFYEHSAFIDLCYYKADIKAFYDTIDQKILIEKLQTRIEDRRLIELIKNAIKNPTVPRNYERDNKYKYFSHIGVPQGLSISNILANIFMEDFDSKLRLKCKYYRYVDDILIFNHNHPSNCLKKYSEILLNQIGLELNEKKTFCKQNKNSFEYLGYYFDIPKVSVRRSTIQRFVNNLASMFINFKNDFSKPQKEWITKDVQKNLFIDAVNERLTGAISENRRYGWLFYFLEINDHEVLHKIDSITKTYFSRLEMFDKVPPKTLKSISKAYYRAKYSPLDGYIHNYNMYETSEQKVKYLIDKGLIDPNDRTKTYTEVQILIMFNKHKNMMLSSLDLDIGTIS